MTSTINNALSRQKVTEETLVGHLSKAQASYHRAKDAASNAAAHAYIIWVDTMSPSAHLDCRKWVDDEIATRNEKIHEHNKNEKKLKKDAEEYNNTKLAHSNSFNGEGETEKDRSDLAHYRAEIIEAASFTSQQWTNRRKVPIDAREGSSMFTKIIKFVFELEYVSQASVVSRYANVLDWIHAKFQDELIDDVTQIVDAIKAAGGFEAALAEQRGNPTNSGASEKDSAAIAQAIVSQVKSVVKSAKAKGSIEMNVNNAQDGIVLMLGRYSGGQVEIVGEMPMTDSELDQSISKFSDDLLLPTNDSIEFLARTLSLGGLVQEGQDSDITVEGMKSGKKEKTQRAITCLPNKKAGLEIMISARYAPASAIIKAVPHAKKITLGSVDTPMLMVKEDSGRLTSALVDRSVRRLLDVYPDSADGVLSWVLENSALMAKKSENAVQTYVMRDLALEAHKPLELDVFRPSVKLDIAIAELRGLYDNCLKDWKDTNTDKKVAKKVTLTFRVDSMICQFEGQPDYSCAVIGEEFDPTPLSFRPKDLETLVRLLIKQPVAEVSIAGDVGGLLCVSWSDSLGQYSVYLPTATKENKLETRRLIPMQAKTSVALAA